MAKLANVAAASGVQAVLIISLSAQGERKLEPNWQVAWLAVRLFLVQSCILALWAVLVYPNFISPLRHLPGPRVSTSLPNILFSLTCGVGQLTADGPVLQCEQADSV